jgi:hypothetical protein
VGCRVYSEIQGVDGMNGWYDFWVANFIVAGSAFAVIAGIVLVRGIMDLRQMLAELRRTHKEF